jgi:class 3 adenylate cyclase
MCGSREFQRQVRQEIENGHEFIRVAPLSSSVARQMVFRECGNPSGPETLVSVLLEERCVLIVDLESYSSRSMEEQVALAQTMNHVLLQSEQQLLRRHTQLAGRPQGVPHLWSQYKSTGDGALFVLAGPNADVSRDPISVRDAIAFATWAMASFLRYNSSCSPEALNQVHARMALAYGCIFASDDLEGNADIFGDAINTCARLASSPRAGRNSILLDDSLYRIMMINRFLFFENHDHSSPASGQLSDFVLGVRPSPRDFLFLHDDGLHPTKDRLLHAYNLSGRLDSIDIQRMGQTA